MMVELIELRKSFGRRVALRDLSFSIPRGKIHGLLGHNGAGKSTAIGCLLGHLTPDHGDARIKGVSVLRDRRRAIGGTGAIFEAPAFYTYLSGYHNLLAFSGYTGPVTNSRLEEVIELVGLKERIHEPVSRYSHGMRQRLGLAQALLPAPELLILDEPTDGLDPEGIHEMRALLERLHREHGLTLLLCSHLLGEVERLCDEVGILHQGELLYHGDWRRESAGGHRFRLRCAEPERALELLSDEVLLRERHPDGELSMEGRGEISPSAALARLVKNGINIHSFGPEPVTLETFYLETLKRWRTKN